jgi:hypothetical protein
MSVFPEADAFLLAPTGAEAAKVAFPAEAEAVIDQVRVPMLSGVGDAGVDIFGCFSRCRTHSRSPQCAARCHEGVCGVFPWFFVSGMQRK